MWLFTLAYWENSNFASLIMGIAIPTVPTCLYVRYKHKRLHARLDEHAALLARIHHHVSGGER